MAMAYEEARQLRLQENRKQLEALGIPQMSKALSKISGTAKRHQHHTPKPRGITTSSTAEPRRSSRPRTNVQSYRDDLELDIDLPRKLRRSRLNSSWASYVARPLHECKTASYEERVQTLKAAEKFQTHLPCAVPSFVKSMVRSHVYSCFWLGLPTKFCVDHLSKQTVEMVLEDERGREYDATYIGKRKGLSGGWRGFALDHKLDDGDTLIFQLVEPNRFKVYMFRVSSLERQEDDANRATDGEESTERAKKRTRATKIEPRPMPEGGKDENTAGGCGHRKRASARLLRKRA